MKKIKDILRKEFGVGYTWAERLFLIAMLAVQVIVFIINPDTPLNIIAGIAGIISVVLCAKGKISSYFIGFIQTFTYMALAWKNCFYGEVIENVFYAVTMVWGIYVWKKHMNTTEEEGNEVEVKKFTVKQWIISIIATIVASIAMGYWLTTIGSHQAYTDATTNILAIFGQILMVRRYREQWLWWLLIDLLCIKMWFVAGNWSMVAMYIAWTINCIYGWYNWSKLSRKAETIQA